MCLCCIEASVYIRYPRLTVAEKKNQEKKEETKKQKTKRSQNKRLKTLKSGNTFVFSMESLMRNMMQGGRMGGADPSAETPLPDTAEKVQISSLSLLKMLKHGRAGVPMEVMGLMLGEFVES